MNKKPIDEIQASAIKHAEDGLAVIELKGKVPVAKGWPEAVPPTEKVINKWFSPNWSSPNIGFVTGPNSGNVFVLDFDDPERYKEFGDKFPQYADTRTVKTGQGFHVYLRAVQQLPPNRLPEKKYRINVEIRANRQNVVLPPSKHYDTDTTYVVAIHRSIKAVPNIDDVVQWVDELVEEKKRELDRPQVNSGGEGDEAASGGGRPESLGAETPPPITLDAKVTTNSTDTADIQLRNTFRLNPLVKKALQEHFEAEHYDRRGDWLDGRCVFPDQHEHGDRNPSFGYNTESGVGNCFACGPILTKDLCEAVGIDYVSLGGLFLREPGKRPTHDEIGDILLEQWDGNMASFRGKWHTYRHGTWHEEPNIDRHIWDVMRDCKGQGINPTASTAKSVEIYLRSQLLVPENQIDQAGDYINMQNGLFNLRTRGLEEHQRELYLTSQLSFANDADAECPKWLAFTDMMLVTPQGEPDPELHFVLQEGFGYSLTADTHHQKSFWLVGGRNSGKSTVIKTLQNLLGSAHVTLDIGALAKDTYQLAKIPGKRVVTCAEMPANAILADHFYKQLVGGDEMLVRPIRQEPFTFIPQCKVWLAMNATPHNMDRSGAVDRRLLIIPFNNSLSRDQWDLHLQDRLDAELPGIFNWALEGLYRLEEQEDFTQAAQIRQAGDDYQKENDIESLFVEAWCDTGVEDSMKASELYEAYSKWCSANGQRPKGSRKVAKDWDRLGFQKKRLSPGFYYYGVTLTAEGRKAMEQLR